MHARVCESECAFETMSSVFGALRSLQPACLANLTPCTRQLFLQHINKEAGARPNERKRARETERGGGGKKRE